MNKQNIMKKIIGIALTVILYVAFWIVLSSVFYIGGLGFWWSVVTPPPLITIGATLICGLIHLILWLLD